MKSSQNLPGTIRLSDEAVKTIKENVEKCFYFIKLVEVFRRGRTST